MKVMILTAGFGTRLRPHTFTKPKPLVSVAGKPVLAHIIDSLLDIRIDELICVTGHLGEQVEEYVRAHYDFPMHFLEQKEMRGQADAIYLARELVSGPLLIVFGDGLFDLDKQRLNSHPSEGILYCKEVEDPSRFGVAVLANDQITRLVEKPTEPVSNLAVIGVYYVPEATRLMDAITYIIEHNIQLKGEYYLANALQVMIDRGEVFRAEAVPMWRDCGTVDALLDTNGYLLEHGSHLESATTHTTIIPPVHIPPTAVIERSVIGPNVSLGENVVIRDSIVRDSIINTGAQVQSAILTHSLIGERARVDGASRELNIGDQSSIQLG